MGHLKALNYPDNPVQLSADNPISGYLKMGTIRHSLTEPAAQPLPHSRDYLGNLIYSRNKKEDRMGRTWMRRDAQLTM